MATCGPCGQRGRRRCDQCVWPMTCTCEGGDWHTSLSREVPDPTDRNDMADTVMLDLFKFLEFRQPSPSGWCAFPETDHPERSHQRCEDNGAGNNAVPNRHFSPCPCACHLGDVYECACGGLIAEAPVLGTDEDGDPIYVHINEEGHMTMEGCRT